jgi:cell wall-associated NlpC family hydrolase
MLTTELVIAEARSWLGTRFSHQGRRRATLTDAGGVDCLGLLIGVARSLHLPDRHGRPLAEHDVILYSRQPDGALLHAVLSSLLEEQPAFAAPQPGQVGLFMFEGQPQHLGIFTMRHYEGIPHVSLLHAYAPARRVVEHVMDKGWKARLVASFALPSVREQGECEADQNTAGDLEA